MTHFCSYNKLVFALVLPRNTATSPFLANENTIWHIIMRLINTFAAAATTSQAVHAVNLFVTSYDGNVTTLSLVGSSDNYTLSESSRMQGCGTQPSWLVCDKPNSVLYCMDENWNFQPTNPSSVFTTFNVDQNSGKLTVAQMSNLTTASS